ncbi:MAG: 16S rRNA (cytosine(1402)-N(4))-methyltransferase RsmH [Dehalococcoidia bacterium]
MLATKVRPWSELLQALPLAVEEGPSRGLEGVVEEGFYHRPVLLHQVLQGLAVSPGGRYIDCTVGEGGHAEAILHEASPGGSLLGIDLDPQALVVAQRRLVPFGDRVVLERGSYAALGELATASGFRQVDGILFDLGLSSLQLECSGRGFSFQREEPLDMRFDPQGGTTAADLVNTAPFEELMRILIHYGEERRARAIARAIMRRRPLSTARELAAVVAAAVGGRHQRLHPATRTFQALRIAVNRELESLRQALPQALDLLKPGGRVVVVSYHSLEDRIVKGTFLREAHLASLEILTRKVLTPSPEERRQNPRSRSARMRIVRHL